MASAGLQQSTVAASRCKAVDVMELRTEGGTQLWKLKIESDLTMFFSGILHWTRWALQNILWLWIQPFYTIFIHFLYLLLKCLTLFLTFRKNSSHVGVTSQVRAMINPGSDLLHQINKVAHLPRCCRVLNWSLEAERVLTSKLSDENKFLQPLVAVWEPPTICKILRDLFFKLQCYLHWRSSEQKMSFEPKWHTVTLQFFMKESGTKSFQHHANPVN